MESAQSEMTFGRQPQPVTITVNSVDGIDIEHWMKKLIAVAKSSGADTRKFNQRCFRIYPRAVND
jgi:hypothetical protein